MRKFETNYYPASIFCRFPRPAFIENIACDDRNNLYVTNIDEGAVYKIDEMGLAEEYAKTNARLTGIVALDGGGFLCGGWAADGQPAIYLLAARQNLTLKQKLPGAQFLNGIAALSPDQFLICDAYAGLIWHYNLSSNQAIPWLKHELLSRLDANDPMPAANGIKVYDGTVFVSNTARNLLLAIPVLDGKAGHPRVLVDDINVDDFAIDEEGTIYAATHIFNSVVEVKGNGVISTIADAGHGVVGSTSALIKRDRYNKRTLYVTTNGGLSLPPVNGLEDGKIVKIDLP
jgi:hypothetical protein